MEETLQTYNMNKIRNNIIKENFLSLRTSLQTKKELKILEHLNQLIYNLSEVLLIPKVEDMQTPQILRIVNSQTEINNILNELHEATRKIKNEISNEKVNLIKQLIDELEVEFITFEDIFS
ncbi:hypothetical protein CDIK_2984 [Cucumispora dikerogammari]|nr:hypothetical protein CDIK_2984 [Cucumispora dikerogammari]